MSHMWQFLIESFKRFVYRLSSHTLYALVYLHSSKWIRLVSPRAGWLSYSLFSALALKCIHSGNTSYPLPANRFFFSVLQKLIPSWKLECLKRHDHLKDIRILVTYYLENFVFLPHLIPSDWIHIKDWMAGLKTSEEKHVGSLANDLKINELLKAMSE